MLLFCKMNHDFLGTFNKHQRDDGVPFGLKREVTANRLSCAVREIEREYLMTRDALYTEWLDLLCQDARQEYRHCQLVIDKAHLCQTCGQVFRDQRRLIEHKAVHEVAAARAMVSRLSSEHRQGAMMIAEHQWASAADLFGRLFQELQNLYALPPGPSPGPTEMQNLEVDEPPPPFAAESPALTNTLTDAPSGPYSSPPNQQGGHQPPCSTQLPEDSWTRVNLHLGPHLAGHIQVPVPARNPLQGLVQAVGFTLGVPPDRISLTHEPGGSYLETDEDLAEAECIWASLLTPNHGPSHGPHVKVFDGSAAGASIETPSDLPGEHIPFFLCHALGIAQCFAGAWTPFVSEDGTACWSFTPTEGLIADSGWSAELVRCNLRRGCIEANPGPRRGKRKNTSPKSSCPEDSNLVNTTGQTSQTSTYTEDTPTPRPDLHSTDPNSTSQPQEGVMQDACVDSAEAGSLRAGPYPKSHCNGGPILTPNSSSSGPKYTSPVLGGAMPNASEDCAEAGSLRAGPYPKSHCNGRPILTPNSSPLGPKHTSPVLGGAMPNASEDCAEAGSLRAGPYPKSHCNGRPILTPNSSPLGPKHTSPVLGGGHAECQRGLRRGWQPQSGPVSKIPL